MRKEFALCSRYNFSSLFIACVCVDARVAKAAPASRPVCRAWLDANAFCCPDAFYMHPGFLISTSRFLLVRLVSVLCVYNIFIVKLKLKSV